MHLQPSIRPGTPADIECLAALAIQVWLHTYATDGIRSTIARYVLAEYTPEHFAHILTNPSLLLLVAEVNHHLVGYALIAFDAACPTEPEGDVELVTLYVQEHFAGQGIGTALLATSREYVRERTGSDALWLTVNARNERAIAFYCSRSFVQAGSTNFEFGGEQHLNHVMITTDG
jgi:ribosomal protein S18 acetylase RimI-like enzyme